MDGLLNFRAWPGARSGRAGMTRETNFLRQAQMLDFRVRRNDGLVVSPATRFCRENVGNGAKNTEIPACNRIITL